MNDRNSPKTDVKDDEQQCEHTGLRTLDDHFSAREVFEACHVEYPGTDVLRTKERLQASASTDRARGGDSDRGARGMASNDRRGEAGVSL